MSSDDLEHLFSYMAIPGHVMANIVEVYKRRYGGALSVNGTLGDSAGALLEAGLCARDVVQVVKMGNLTSLEWVLSSSEKRDKILDVVLGTFVLSERDQMRLVRRKMSAKMAARVISLTTMCDEAKKVAAARTEGEARITYVVEHFSSVDAVKDVVVSLRGSDNPAINAGALISHQGLRGEALRGGGAAVRAACWTELEKDDWAVAMATARRSVSGSYQDPLVGLMAQPSLPLEMYAELYDLASDAQFELLFLACGGVGPKVGVDRLCTASEEDASVLVAQYSRALDSRAYEASWNVLEGLSWNQNLTPGGQVSSSLIEAIAVQMELRGGTMDRWLWPALVRACALDGTRTPEEVLVSHGYTTWGAGRLRKIGRGASGPLVSANRLYEAPLRVVQPKHWEKLTAGDLWRMHGKWGIYSLGAALGARFGDGSSAESRSTWMAFFSLVEDGPEMWLGQLCEASTTLVRGELVGSDHRAGHYSSTFSKK